MRLDLAGGWTDVPPFSDREGGAVVNLTISRYCYVTIRPRAEGVALASLDYNRRREAESLEAIQPDGELDLLQAAALQAAVVGAAPHGEPSARTDGRGYELIARSEVPPGSGTGSSASMAVALAGALAAWNGRPLSPAEATIRAWQIERRGLGIAGGLQDQCAAAYGGASALTFPPGGSAGADPAFQVEALRLAPATVAELEARLVLAYTGLPRLSGNIIDAVMGAYTAGVPETVSALRALRRIAGDVRRQLLDGEVEALGRSLGETWACQRRLHQSVSNASVDELMAIGQRAGAIGGKALGAGGGGCLLFLAGVERTLDVQRALSEAGAQLLDCRLTASGLQVWTGAS